MRACKVLLATVLCWVVCSGCAGSQGPAQKALNADMILRQQNALSNWDKEFEGLVGAWRDGQIATIDAQTVAAKAAVTKPDGTAHVNSIEGINASAVSDKILVDQAVLDARAKHIKGEEDAVNVLAGMQGLAAANVAPSNSQLIQQGTTVALQLVQQYLATKRAPAPSVPIPAPITVVPPATTAPSK